LKKNILESEERRDSIFCKIKRKIIRAIKNPDSILTLKQTLKILFMFGTVASIISSVCQLS
jgi:hypothetical protein